LSLLKGAGRVGVLGEKKENHSKILRKLPISKEKKSSQLKSERVILKTSSRRNVSSTIKKKAVVKNPMPYWFGNQRNLPKGEKDSRTITMKSTLSAQKG